MSLLTIFPICRAVGLTPALYLLCSLTITFLSPSETPGNQIKIFTDSFHKFLFCHKWITEISFQRNNWETILSNPQSFSLLIHFDLSLRQLHGIKWRCILSSNIIISLIILKYAFIYTKIIYFNICAYNYLYCMRKHLNFTKY